MMHPCAQDAGGRMLNQTALEASEVDGVSTTMEFGSLTFKNFATLGDQLRRILADVDVVIDETRYPGARVCWSVGWWRRQARRVC